MSKPICLDKKRRASFPSKFKPGDAFDRTVEGNAVVFRKLERAETPTVKPIRTRDGFLMLPVKLERKRIAAAIRADRDAQ